MIPKVRGKLPQITANGGKRRGGGDIRTAKDAPGGSLALAMVGFGCSLVQIREVDGGINGIEGQSIRTPRAVE